MSHANGDRPIWDTSYFRAQTDLEKQFPFLLNPTFTTVQMSASNATDNDVSFTVESGKRAFVLTSRALVSSGSPTPILNLKRSGTYYQLAIATSLLNTNVIGSTGFVLEAGDVLSFNHGGLSGVVNYSLGMVKFDIPATTARGLKTFSNLSLSNGANTLATVGAGCKMVFPAFGYGGILLGGGSVNTTNTSAGFVFNASGGTRLYDLNLVPSGGSADATNIFISALSTTTGTRATFTPGGSMAAGDAIIVTTNAGTATQTAWITGYEF